MDPYYSKYLKYKSKYHELKKMAGGSFFGLPTTESPKRSDKQSPSPPKDTKSNTSLFNVKQTSSTDFGLPRSTEVTPVSSPRKDLVAPGAPRKPSPSEMRPSSPVDFGLPRSTDVTPVSSPRKDLVAPGAPRKPSPSVMKPPSPVDFGLPRSTDVTPVSSPRKDLVAPGAPKKPSPVNMKKEINSFFPENQEQINADVIQNLKNLSKGNTVVVPNETINQSPVTSDIAPLSPTTSVFSRAPPSPSTSPKATSTKAVSPVSSKKPSPSGGKVINGEYYENKEAYMSKIACWFEDCDKTWEAAPTK
jgi:hypothetical protein